MQPPTSFYSRYAPAPILSHPSTPPYPQTSSAPSYVYTSQYPSPYPPHHPSVAYSPYHVTHSPHASPFLPNPHPIPSVHLQPPAVIASPAIYAPHPSTPRAPPNAPSPYPPPSPESCERDAFYRKLHAFRDAIGEPIQRLPTLGFKELDLWVLYKEVIKRRGIDAVIAKKQWKEVAEALQLPSSCTDSGFRLRLHYKKYLEAFERKFYDPPENAIVTTAGRATLAGKDNGHQNGKKAKNGERQHKGKKGTGCSVTSSGSAETAVGDLENESAGGSVSNGSRRSSGGSSGRSEATSKGESVSRVVGGIVKKKKRSREGGGLVGAMKRDGKDKEEKVDQVDEVMEEVNGDKVNGEEEGEGKSNVVVVDESDTEKQDENGRRDQRIEERKNDTEAEASKEEVASGESCRERTIRTGGLTGSVSSKGMEKISCSRQGIDFSVLDSATLKRYARVHGVGSGVGDDGGKKALAEIVGAHFSKTPLRGGETATVLRFIQAVRRR